MILRRTSIFIFVVLFLTSFALAQQAPSRGAEIVAGQTFVMIQPPRHVPTGDVVDGPILGNGDVGVSMAGPPEDQRFYLGKNDFWNQQASVLTVGGVEIAIPALQGATYREEEDLLKAEVRGTFTSPAGLTVKMSSWVAATENLLVTELESEGGANVDVHARLFPAATAIVNNDKPIQIGREQNGKGRWFFDGLVDEVHLYDRALNEDEISKLMHFEDPAQGLVRRWDFDAAEGSTPQDTKAKMIAGPRCQGPQSVEQPDERPMDILGCQPDGQHEDYHPYAQGIRGRAAKFMHDYAYLDAGPVPPMQQVTVAAWIYIFSAGDANYILSKGDWNEAYGLSLDNGRLRFNVGDRFVRSQDALPTNRWVHVAGTFDGKILRAYVDGEEVLPGARFITGGAAADTIWISRNADGPVEEFYAWKNPLPPTRTALTAGREVTFAARLVGAQGTIHDGTIDFTLPAGKTVYLVTPALSDLDARNHEAAVLARAQALTVSSILQIREAHREWWRKYWNESFVELSDPLVEKYYYSSQYATASAARTGKVAPGLYSPWITTDRTAWRGNYTVDFNYQAWPLAMYSSNHVATSDPYDQPVLDFMTRGELYAKTILHDRGVFYPGNLGPWGMERPLEFDPFMGMKSNAVLLAMPMLMRYYSTYDDRYAAKIYPFLRDVGDFWEDDLDRSHGTYTIHDDCVNETGPWLGRPDWDHCPEGINPTGTLAFLRTTFQGLIDISRELGVDESKRAGWQDILDHLSPYPTGEVSGKTIFLSAQNAPPPNRSWTISSWAIWLAGQIGLGKDSKLLEIARNNFDQGRISDHPLVLPSLPRVGYDPAKVLAVLDRLSDPVRYPNGYTGGGGIQGAETVPATVNEMLLQSFSGVLRLFPDWPRDKDATFGDLRAYGAFLVSSSLQGGRVGQVTIVSEKGRDCALANPWPGKKLRLARNGRKSELLTGSEVRFHTTAGETISIQPE